MKGKRLSRILVSFCLLLILLALPSIAACAKPAPAPTPAPAPAPTPAPPPAKEKVVVELYGFKLGTVGYIATFALAELINKKSDWVRAVAIESVLGGNENASMLIRHPEKQDRMVGFMPNMTMWSVLNGKPPFEKPFAEMRHIAMTTTMGHFFVTTDPKIKSLEDIKGKRVSLMPKGSLFEEMARMLLQHGYGITYDHIKVVHLDLDPAADALIDGTIDVAYLGTAIHETEPYKVVPIPAMEKAFTAKTCYIVPYSMEAVNKTRAAWGAPFYGVKTRAMTVGKTQLPETVTHILTSGWSVTTKMPDDVVTEILRIIYENVEQFGTYHATLKAMTKQTLSAHGSPKSYFHPAAIKFYEGKGLKVGMD